MHWCSSSSPAEPRSSSLAVDQSSRQPSPPARPATAAFACLVNNTTLDASVVFTAKDTAQEGAFPPGGQLCGEGTVGFGNDVAGNVVWATPSWTTGFTAANPWIGQPEAFVTESNAAGLQQCIGQGQ